MIGGELIINNELLRKIGLAVSQRPEINSSLRSTLSEIVEVRGVENSEDAAGTTDDSSSESSVNSIEDSVCSEDGVGSAFFVADMSELRRQYTAWRALLPRIEPWYAVKCNPSPTVVSTLINLGTGADCASKDEIDLALAAGLDVNSIIFANPCKTPAHIRYAKEVGVKLMTFDNEDELFKIRKIYPSAELVLRIQVDDSSSVCQFNVKFGATLESVPALLRTAKELSLNVVGVSFHVGSGCRDVGAFHDAVRRAHSAFAVGAAIGYDFKLLDVGGGFPGADNDVYTGGIRFADIAACLGAAVEQYFPDRSVKVIAEPGRYFASSAMTLLTQVHSKRRVPLQSAASASHMYYLNDGVYGSFNCIIFDHYTPSPRVLTCKGAVYTVEQDLEVTRTKASLWGPTCDSMDCVMKDVALPELAVGDWLCFEGMGAYTGAAASNFNGLYTTRTVYIDSGSSSSSSRQARD